MQPTKIAPTLLAALLTSGALANDIDGEAARNGYQRLPPLTNEKGAIGATSKAAAYVKIVEPGRKLQILDLGAKSEQPNTSYSIVSFEIDCPKMSMRYRSAQLLDPPWNPKGVERPVRGPWHSPKSNSVQEQALSLTCKA
jgi:hypothetical protein